MSSSFLASSSSSASSPLSCLIPRSPAPPPHSLMVQSFSCGVLTQGCSANDAGGVPGSGVEAVRVQGSISRHAEGRRPPPPRPPPRQCPRCRSANTKFCYYNNYSRAQPRYLCRACRRHWTEGGTLRDVPVGGGRKNRRGGGAKASAAAATASAAAAASAQLGSSGPPGGADAFPDILRQLMLFQPAAADVAGGGYGNDLSAWQQMAAATAQQGAGDVGAGGGAAADANCGGVQYWSGWQQDDMPGFDGAF